MAKRERASFVRQKRIICGENRMEVKIYNRTAEQDESVTQPRGKRRNVTPPKVRDLNDKHSREYFGQLTFSNFHDGDLCIHATYAPENRPADRDDATRQRNNFLRRIKYACQKKNLPEPKFLNVEEEGANGGNWHHHIFIHTDLERDEVEDLWRKRPRKGQKQGDRLGYINADRIQGDPAKLIGYIAKDFGAYDDEETAAQPETEREGKKRGRPKNKRRWSGSHNLTKPQEQTNDHAWSKREVEKVVREQPDGQPNTEYWERRFPGWTLIGGADAYRTGYSEDFGWSISLIFKKKEVKRRNHAIAASLKSQQPKIAKQTNASI
jgi:hypothetical protein